MRAIVAETAERLVWQDVPDATAGPGEVLIKVAAAGVNRADVLQAAGKYPPPPGASETIGMEVSGTIADVGAEVTKWSVGQGVCALLAGGGYAEYVAVPAGQVMPVPAPLDLVDAAGVPEVACTVWSNLVMTAHLGPGQLVLLHGGASGIGSHAIQVARALGARVAVTAGSADKLELCRELGAQIAISYRDEDFVARLMQETDGKGADVILDIMGAAYLDRNVDALATDGQLVIIGMQGGVKAELNIGKLMAKRARVIGTTLRARPVSGPNSKSAIVDAVTTSVWPMFASQRVRPIIGKRLPIQDAAEAHRLPCPADGVVRPHQALRANAGNTVAVPFRPLSSTFSLAPQANCDAITGCTPLETNTGARPWRLASPAIRNATLAASPITASADRVIAASAAIPVTTPQPMWIGEPSGLRSGSFGASSSTHAFAVSAKSTANSAASGKVRNSQTANKASPA